MSSIVLKYYSIIPEDSLYSFCNTRRYDNNPESYTLNSTSTIRSLRYDSYSHLNMDEVVKEGYRGTYFYINSLCCADNLYNETGKIFTKEGLVTYDF